ncbi:TonB-dependent receptor [Sphingomonas sp. RP10(2022)]|uniref:TonB-dependent receptor n=1 Tax=Sphingomonas liriopis TaxID=2949094 RepID=A0A9X2HS27_9SPHN|nr:TonB-dependent receptor plug domain-containing protein [Sphingomonas liriopis]MCP3735482.1 TonB-dependent receptor [Sphingomonas liriopis]
MTFWKTAVAAGAMLAATAPVAAQTAGHDHDARDTSFSVGDIVVTARDMVRGTGTVTTSVDRLSGGIAQQQSVDNAWELFARLPGVTLTDFNQGTTSGRFSIRGFNGEGEINAVKLLIDGIPSNANDGGMPFIDAVMPLDIAGVELVRGTADPRYGLHAIAGSADITTRIGGDYLDVRGLGGAFGTVEGQLAGGVETGRLSQNYFLGYRRSDGFRDHAGLDRVSLAGKWFYDAGAVRLGGIARYAEVEAEEPGYLTDADAYTNRRRSYPVSASDGGQRSLSQYSLHLDADLTDRLALSAKGYANGLNDDRYVRFSANVAQQRRLTREQQYGAMATLHYHPQVAFLHRLMLEAGGDVQVQDNESLRWLTADRRITSQTRDQAFGLTVTGGYAQAVIEPVTWLSITPGWRFDTVSGSLRNRLNGQRYPINRYGTISQPKVSVAITPVGGVTAYANYGRSFQIGVGAGAYKVPPRTTDLDPSINEGWEAGIKLARGRWLEARVAAWQQTASGEIKRRLNDPSGDSDNLGATRRRGIDVQVSVTPVAGATLWGAYSYQHARIVTPDPATPSQAGNWIDHVPQNLFSGGVDWAPAARWRVSLWGNGQSSYHLTPANTLPRYGDYLVVGGEVAWRVLPKLEVAAQMKNIGDRHYEYVWYDGTQVLHSPADGRALYGSVRLTL